VDYLPIDIRNRQAVIEACRGASRIFHILSLVPISKAGNVFWDVNVEGTRNILEGALKHGVQKILHMSSSAVYGISQPSPLSEESKLNPLGVYGRSNYDGESVCRGYRKSGLDISIVRPRTVIGPERLGIFSILFDWIGSGKNIYIIGSGANRIQFVEVSELAEACIRITEKAVNDEFNLGTDRFETLRDDLGGLIRHAGSRSRIVGLNPFLAISSLRLLDTLGLSPLADWHYLTYHKDFYFNVTKAKTVLDWQPKFSNLEMLTESYDWYVKNHESIQRETGTTHRKNLRQGILKLLKNLS
jgi:nucleoside-diphosphate-sugar epimerase